MSIDEFAGVGFAPGVVRGVRSFKIDKIGRLTGIHYPQVWRPCENDADCRKGEDNGGGWAALGGGLTSWSNTTLTYYLQGNSPAATVTIPEEAKRVIEKHNEPKPHSMTTCKCGFYAYYDGSDDYHQKGYVSAVVEGYGETLIGSRGFRAMKARIVALRIPKSVKGQLAMRVARNYADIPLFASFKQMVSEFPPDVGDMSISPDTDPEFWTRAVS